LPKKIDAGSLFFAKKGGGMRILAIAVLLVAVCVSQAYCADKVTTGCSYEGATMEVANSKYFKPVSKIVQTGGTATQQMEYVGPANKFKDIVSVGVGIKGAAAKKDSAPTSKLEGKIYSASVVSTAKKVAAPTSKIEGKLYSASASVVSTAKKVAAPASKIEGKSYYYAGVPAGLKDKLVASSLTGPASFSRVYWVNGIKVETGWSRLPQKK